MKILLSNDDGIYAEGLQALAGALRRAGHRLIVVAPDQEKSATSHAITISSPLRVKKVENNERLGEEAYKVNGTPADCIKLALRLFEDFNPDLVLTGINHGQNLGYDVFYSGTVAGAAEAHLQGFKSAAVSLALGKKRNFSLAAELTVKILNQDKSLFAGPISGPLNLNFPDVDREEIKGLKLTRLAAQIYERSVEERVDPAGRSYFWFVGGKKDNFDAETDIGAIKSNYISLSPLNFELTDSDRIRAIDPRDIDIL